MYEHGIIGGVLKAAMWPEIRSLNTVGNAVYTKVDVLIPNSWRNIAVVTSDWHMDRTLSIFNHVLGNDYTITGIPTPSAASPIRKATEWMSGRATREVVRGTKRGDHGAIGERMHRITPGYAQATTIGLGARCLVGLVRDAARI
jgi:uncharacterized SAM-binding protein YcdF (DUF218 family)